MTATPSTTTDRTSPPRLLALARGLGLDVGLPVAAYYVLRLLGASDWVALLAASAAAAVRIAWSAVRSRELNAFATVMLLVYGIGFALAFATGDPRTMLLRTSLITAGVAAVFLVTAARGKRPLTLTALQSFNPGRSQQLQHEYDTKPEVRRGYRLSSAIWGGGLLAEAVLRIPLVYLLPIDVAVGATEALAVVAIVALMGWNVWYVARARRRAQHG
ncbi:VC0807 family protein [Pseudonocardia thermophila]|uniref:VC0807 family protein n=1 Tax=Pseudonocardia thermophila TaxID=1848 RepID=UPI00248E0E9C|nr:VC0807 family protein [Pseudonocardia thermophila]